MDYRAESPRDAVPRLAPDGIDVYFDNVGGPHLVAALHNMKIGGRVALCGMISQYSDDGRGQDINHLIEAVLRRVTIRGFIVRDHEDMRPEFEDTVAGWLRSGEVEALQTVTDGIDHAVDGVPRDAQGRQRRQGARPPRHQLDDLSRRHHAARQAGDAIGDGGDLGDRLPGAEPAVDGRPG